MTHIKLCGLRRKEDIDCVNKLLPEYIGFVFAKKSKRYVSAGEAKCLVAGLDKRIRTVGVFVDEKPGIISAMVRDGIIQVAQLHGKEQDEYIRTLRQNTDCSIIKAFRIRNEEDVKRANLSEADLVLLDSDGGSGKTFDWTLLHKMNRPYFLAGGLTPENVGRAIRQLRPYGVDASSSLETDGWKDKEKMTAFVNAVRKEV